MKRAFTIFFLLLISSNCLASEPYQWQTHLQNPASPIMDELHKFHDLLMIIITSIVVFVFILLVYVCYKFNAKRNPTPATFTHNVAIEVIWTIIPVIILVVISIPSFRILKMVTHPPQEEMTIKVVGSQWYWSYVYTNPEHQNIAFDSYMILTKDLKPGQRRLLEVDNRIIIPQSTIVKFLITGADVIHSFAIPSLGIKTDAVPGKINETWTKIDKLGVYYGQCSEICGVNHAFMPIAIEVVSKEDFEKWLKDAKIKFGSASWNFKNSTNFANN